MEVEVIVVLLVADARQVREDVLVDVEREGRRREFLVIDRGVEGKGLVDDLDDLRKCGSVWVRPQIDRDRGSSRLSNSRWPSQQDRRGTT